MVATAEQLAEAYGLRPEFIAARLLRPVDAATGEACALTWCPIACLPRAVRRGRET